MSSEWELKTLGEFCPFKYGKGLPERDRKPGDYGVFSSAGLVGSHEAAYVDSPGVVIGRKGTVGSVTYSPASFWPIDTAFYVEDQPEIRDIRFTYYLLKTLNLHLMNTDSAVPGLNRDNAHALEVRVPPLSEQKTIADVLQQIDDRITLLRETSVTLEAIAQAIFKSWFVDFDPVRAKQEGRAPEGMDETTAALFPDSFEESELGLVPRGWGVEWLSNVFDFKEGPGIRNWQYTNSDVGTRFINIRCIQDGDLSIETANRITDEEANGKYAHFHLKSWDVVVSTSGTLGRSAIVREDHLPLMLNTSVIRFRPVEGMTCFSYVYEYLNTPEFMFKVESMASGSVQKNFGPMHLKQMKLVLPPIELIVCYESAARPLFEKIVTNRARAQTLAALRDTLLPRLISGQLRLPDAEDAIAEVVA